jgi:hypothetical protein
VNARTRTGLLAAAALVAGALIMGGSLWPVLGPLTERTPLPAATRSTDAGVPVPASAQRCAGEVGSLRWCVPSGVSVRTLSQWYDDVLPPGHDAGPLRWCVEQRLGDGGRRALWSTGAGLVGYVLPSELPPVKGHIDTVGVDVVSFPGSACPSVARASREQG